MTTITIGIARPDGKPAVPLTLPADLPLGEQTNIVAAAQALLRLSRENRALVLKTLGEG